MFLIYSVEVPLEPIKAPAAGRRVKLIAEVCSDVTVSVMMTLKGMI